MLKAYFIIALLLSTLAFAVNFGTAQAANEVTGIISLDTTWVKANSPYIVTGNVLGNNGAP